MSLDKLLEGLKRVAKSTDPDTMSHLLGTYLDHLAPEDAILFQERTETPAMTIKTLRFVQNFTPSEEIPKLFQYSIEDLIPKVPSEEDQEDEEKELKGILQYLSAFAEGDMFTRLPPRPPKPSFAIIEDMKCPPSSDQRLDADGARNKIRLFSKCKSKYTSIKEVVNSFLWLKIWASSLPSSIVRKGAPQQTVKYCPFCPCIVTHSDSLFNEMADPAKHFQYFHEECDNCLDIPPAPPGACDPCKHLRLNHLARCVSWDREYRMSLRWHASQSFKACSACPLCRYLAANFPPDYADDPKKLEQLEFRLQYLPKPLGGDGEVQFGLYSHAKPLFIGRLASAVSPAAQRLDPSGLVDLQLISTWLSSCPTSCYQSSMDCLPQDFRLVDVQRNCLVKPPEHCRYVALSYCWEPASETTVTTLRENVDKFGQDGALCGLPNTIVDAISVCKDLGERYLWVDRLCIVQDDQDSKMAQIMAMADIYASAALTIAAVAEVGMDATSGLCGVSRSRQVGLTWQSTVIQPAVPPLSEVVSQSRWGNRAWTFQEEIFSPRILFFTEKGCFLDCRVEGRRESELGHENTDGSDMFSMVVKSPQNVLDFSLGFNFDLARDSTLSFLRQVEKLSTKTLHQRREKNYYERVEEYSSRKLTLHSDKLNAFEGMIQRLSTGAHPCHGKRFEWGLPVKEFDYAILWSPSHDSLSEWNPLQSEFPSWSWLSLDEQVHYGGCSNCCRMVGTKDFSCSLASWAFARADQAGNCFLEPMGSYHAREDGIFASTRPHLMALVWRQGCFTEEYHACREGAASPIGDCYYECWKNCRGITTPGRACLKSTEPVAFCDCASDLTTAEMQIFTSKLQPRVSEDDLRLASDPGRILLFTQSAAMRIERFPENTDELHNLCILRMLDGAFAGHIYLQKYAADIVFDDQSQQVSSEMEFLALSIAEVRGPGTEAQDLWVKASRPGAEYLKWQDLERIEYIKWQDLGRINTVDVWKSLTNDPFYTDISSEESDLSPLVVRVMLIFRKDGIARRLGLGEVHLPKWLQLEREHKTVVLG